VIDSDKATMKSLLNMVQAANSKKPFDDPAIDFYFMSLMGCSMDSVRMAILSAGRTKEASYGLNIGLVERFLGVSQAEPETIEGIIAKAKLKKCPLGIMASRYITNWHFQELDSFAIRQRAVEYLEMLPNIELDIQANGYPDHELSLMVKYGVNPTDAFRPGIAGPADSEATRAQYARLKYESRENNESQAKYALQHSSISESEIQAAKLRIAQEMATIQPKSTEEKVSENAQKHAAELAKVDELLGGE